MTSKSPQTYRLIAVITPIILLIASGILLSGTSKNNAQRLQNLQDFNLKVQANQESESLHQFIVTNRTSLEKMSLALPSESMMIGVIQDVESVLNQFDPQASVKFSSQNPVKSGQDLIIPLNLSLQLPLNKLTPLIDELNGLPYLTQLLTVDAQTNGELTQIIINMRLYVKDPFIGF
jgi:hypothetical protein